MMKSAPTYLRSAARPNTVVSSTKMPTMIGPDEGAENRAESAEGYAGEDEQQDLRAHVERDAGAVIGPEDASE